MGKTVVVTGGNAGIGLALCKQLAVDHGLRVFMLSRSIERGEAAMKDLNLPASTLGTVELVHCDVTDTTSVAAAAAKVKSLLGDAPLDYLVNNAGVGLGSKATPEEVVDTNLRGAKRVSDAFVTMMPQAGGRIVNVGSGAGPMYVAKCPKTTWKFLCESSGTWDEIEAWTRGPHGLGSEADGMGGYGLSKAMLHCYSILLSKEHPHITTSTITPGFIETKMTAGYGATKKPEEGTVSIKRCLFDKLGGNGWFFGSDGLRSPCHFLRNPGEPEFDGVLPTA